MCKVYALRKAHGWSLDPIVPLVPSQNVTNERLRVAVQQTRKCEGHSCREAADEHRLNSAANDR